MNTCAYTKTHSKIIAYLLEFHYAVHVRTIIEHYEESAGSAGKLWSPAIADLKRDGVVQKQRVQVGKQMRLAYVLNQKKFGALFHSPLIRKAIAVSPELLDDVIRERPRPLQEWEKILTEQATKNLSEKERLEFIKGLIGIPRR